MDSKTLCYRETLRDLTLVLERESRAFPSQIAGDATLDYELLCCRLALRIRRRTWRLHSSIS